MKKLILFIAILLTFNACKVTKNGGKTKSIKFDKGKFEEVLAKAKEEDKILFIDFWASWCGPCKRMDQEVLSNKEIVTFFNDNFINIKLDADSQDALLPKINYDVRSIPAYIWVDGDGNMIYNYRGTTTVENFLQLGKNALMNGGKEAK